MWSRRSTFRWAIFATACGLFPQVSTLPIAGSATTSRLSMSARPWRHMPHRSSSHPTRTDRYQPKNIEPAMTLSHFFIDHPRFAAVISIFIMVFGLAAAAFLPVAQYPNIVPPTVQVTTTYLGASADVVARTVATPLEQAINGVEG